MAIKAVIWDLGGVLVRTGDGGSREALAAELGFTREELDKEMFDNEGGKKGQVGLISGADHWHQLANSFGIEHEELMDRFFEADQLDVGLVAFIRELKKRVKVGLLSNAFSTLRKNLEEWNILDLFDDVVISAEVGLIKPDAGIYQMALDGLGVQAEEAIFVDDLKHNIEAANALGMKGVQFQTREQAIGKVQRLMEEK